MPPSPLETPPRTAQHCNLSYKGSEEAEHESQESTQSTTLVREVETNQDDEIQPALNAHQDIFARFMSSFPCGLSQETRADNRDDKQGRKRATSSEATKRIFRQQIYSSIASRLQSTPPESYHNKSSVVKFTNESDPVVKVEDGLPQESQKIPDSVPQAASEADQTNDAVQTEEQDEGNISIPNPSTRHSAADFLRDQDKGDFPRQVPGQKEVATREKPLQDGGKGKDTETNNCNDMKDVDQSTISAEDIGTMEKSHSKSGNRRKHKQSRKRSKSRGRSKSPKRRKVSESFIPDHELEYAEGRSDEEQSPKKFNVERARARIPKGCSVRHEHDQKEEMRDGKKIVKSKRFTKMMRSTLKDHQVTALSWMVKREKETPRIAHGGIIGDEMGLGKTVTSLACIAANKLPKKDRKKFAQATLIVVPNRKVANQWLEEAKKHWHEEASSCVSIYTHGSDHVTKQYEKQWIVLATYTQVRNHLPPASVMGPLHAQYADDLDTLRQEVKKKSKPLLLIEWFRVIVDEGQGITKWNGRTLEACTRIQAKHRWVLSGTPIQNKPLGEAKNAAKSNRVGYCRAAKMGSEFYSYATFICCEILGSRRIFRNEYIVEDATNDDFDTLASVLMYRRTADTKLKIPPTTHKEVYVEISREEEIICNAINSFFRAREQSHQKEKEDAEKFIFEKELDDDEVEDVQPMTGEEEEEDLDQKTKKSRTTCIQASWQLRLRQALSHPYCLEKFLMGDYLSEDDFKLLISQLKLIGEEKTIIEQLEEDEDWENNLGQYQIGLDKLKSRKEPFIGGVFNMNELLDLVLLQRAVKIQKCGNGTCEIQNLSRFKCGHFYCGQCLGNLMMQMSNSSEEERSSGLKCSIDGCGETLLFGREVTTLTNLAFSANKDKTYVEIGRDSIKSTVDARLGRSPFFVASSYGPRIVPPPSSRLAATMAVVMTWLTEAPQDKIIIFTQFIPTLKMLGYQLETLGIKFVYYSGMLTRAKQEQAMNVFHNDPETLIMISTMKSGGQSHNLTVANRVLIVDLWWNKAAEKQAISRVARIGQKKETYSVRIVTKHSMDDWVIQVQTDKEATVARMLQDDGHERIEVNDERLERIFERKDGDQVGAKRRKRQEDSSE